MFQNINSNVSKYTSLSHMVLEVCVEQPLQPLR